MKICTSVTTTLLAALLLAVAAGCSKQDTAAGDPAGAEQMAETDLVQIETSMGTITVKLDSVRAPLSVKNFKAYVRAGFYDKTIIHRIENKGMYLIQAGGIQQDRIPKSPLLPAISCESNNGLKNRAGTIGYGRRADPNTATSHFYINYKDNPGFDYDPERGFTGYAVFGEIVDGNDVAEAIANLERVPGSSEPIKQVLIKSAKIIMKKKEAPREKAAPDTTEASQEESM
ncbi:peptidylprolyl isomerase [bacterium]|nr:peptidylprolyl isomerase [bacterium]